MSITKITAETIRHCIYGTYKVELDTKQRVKTEQGCQEIKILAECITFPFEQWIAVGRDKKTITFTPAKKRNVQRMVNYIKKLKTKIKSAEYSGTHHKQIYNIIQPIVQNKLIEKTISTNTIFITSPPPSMCKERLRTLIGLDISELKTNNNWSLDTIQSRKIITRLQGEAKNDKIAFTFIEGTENQNDVELFPSGTANMTITKDLMEGLPFKES